MNGEARTARLSRVGGTATPPLTTVLARAARKPEDPLLASISTSRPKRQWGPKRRAGPAGRWGGGWRGAGPEERGAGRAGQGGPGASLREEVPAPRFGEVRPRRLRTAPCAPSPTIGPDLAARGPCGGGAGGSRARPVSVRARGDEDGGPAPAGPGPRAVRGGSLGSWLRDPHPRTPAAGSTWTLGRGGTERAPRPHVGEGALQPVPLFCSSAWGSDCSKGGRKNPGFRVSRPPQPGGEGPRRDTPSAPAPLDLAASEPWSRRGGAAPRPQPIGPGAGRPPERRRRTSCRLTRVPAAAAHAPSTGRVGPRASVAPPPPLAIGSLAVVRVPEPAPRSPGNLHPPMPTPHEAGNQHTGPEEADQPPSMSSHDVAPPAAPSRNPCCLWWCCCCSCSRNEERRRAWRASGESKLQPLPSCEVCTPSPEEVQGWAQSFDKLMHSPAGRSAFREFLRTEYSEENMLFWLACEELKAEADQHAVDEKARLIYEDYVSILSPKEVSLDSRIREGINKKMQEPSAHTFDDAQLQIYTLMHRDPYPRFLGSPAYRALLLRGAPQSSHEA